MTSKEKLLSKKEIDFLYTYLNSSSPTSYEMPGQKIWLEYLKPFIDTYEVDNYGTTYGIVNADADYKVVIEAHADEISWYVKYIDDDGYIYVLKNGGSDAVIALSQRANFHTKKGFVKGVFGWPAVHLRNSKSPNPNPNNIFVDVGANNKKEVLEMGINVGTIVTFDADLIPLNKGKLYAGRAVDNRIGGFIIAQVARLLKENKKKLPFGLYIVNAVMEEVGLRGAEMISRTIEPDVAIITDVGHDTCTPLIEKKREGEFKCGKGPMLTYGPAVQNNLLQLIIDTADKNKIPYQLEAVSRRTGTDTDAFAFSNKGVVSALISLPMRYMHTTVETISIEDVENTILLYYHTLLNIEANHNFKYFS